MGSLIAPGLAACQSSAERATADGAQAQQLLELDRPAAAAQLIAEAIARRDDIAALHLIQAHVALARGNRNVAYQAYANALALEATNPEALAGVAQLGVGTGHLREAERAADQMLTLDIQRQDALLTKGIGAIVRNDFDSAIANADQILAISPDNVGGLILKSRALAMRGDRTEALAMMKSAVARTGYTPEMTMSLIELARATGDADSYFSLLTRLRQLVPDNLDYRLDLVEALYKRGLRDEAQGELATLLTLPALQATTPIEQVIRLWNGYDPAAPTATQLAAARTSMSAEARQAIARRLIATGRAGEAQALLRPLATGRSSDVNALYARAADANGDPAAAQSADAILREDPDNGDALLLRARRLPATAAIIDYQRVIRNYPAWDEGYIGLARAYRALNRPVGVRRAFEDGLRARPQSYPLTVAYLRQLAELGDSTRATEVARRFALDSPALPRAWKLYAATCRDNGGVDCAAEAAEGLSRSQKRFGLDPAPGTPPSTSLIGRIG